jgi:hypothetical protein
VTDDIFIIKNLPLYFSDSTRTCLHLPATRSMTGRSCTESSSATSRACTPAPPSSESCAIASSSRGEFARLHMVFLQALHQAPQRDGQDAISAFQNGMTCTTLIHRLGRRTPRTTRELLNIATNHTDGEEAVTATLNTPPSKGN